MKHTLHPNLPNWAHSLIRVALGVLIGSFVILALSVYFRSFLLVMFGALLLFSSVVSFLSMAQATKPKGD